MANTKISALTALSTSQIATGDQFVIVDVSDTTHAASGTTKKLAASGLVWTDGAQTITGAKTFSAAVTFSDIIAMAHARTRSDAIADDNVAVITPFQNTGVILINATTFTNTVSGILSYRAASGAIMHILAGGANLESSTSILTGTTGTDGKVTISANSNGNIYLENRMGGSITFRAAFLC